MTAVDTLTTIREQAAQRFTQLGWPTPRQEEWRYTNVAPIAKIDWTSPVGGQAPPPVHEASMRGRALVELVFVNGRFVERIGDGADGASQFLLRQQ